MQPETTPAHVLPLGTRLGARLRWTLTLLGVLVVAALGWLIFREAKSDSELTLWDEYAELRGAHEDRETYFEPGGELTQTARDRYVAALLRFLEKVEKEGTGDALEPQVRWRIVKTEGESLLAMQDVLDMAKRQPHIDRALQQLQVLRDRFPDFPLNWGNAFAPPGHANQARKLQEWFGTNAAWEREWLPKDLPPDPGVVVVFRTERGDLRMGPYSTLGPRATARLLENVQRGAYDGTAFTARFEDDSTGQPTGQGVRAGDARARDAKPHDAKDHLRFAKPDEAEPQLLDETRNRVLHVRGVVTLWHEAQDLYDHPQELVFLTRDGSSLNYRFTPVGRLLDDASLATLDRIYGAKTWKDDPIVASDTGELALLREMFKAPTKIVKALAYKDGALLSATAGALPTRVDPEETEKTLGTLKPDAYRKEPPPEPAPTPTPLPGQVPPSVPPASPPGPDSPAPPQNHPK
jgi:cyclophilin family peptidyl-prolyl cis-trans isomerase